MLRFLTAGESHGPALLGIVEGMPAGLPLTQEDIARDLARRQRGYGRGDRMAIEHDRAEVLSGLSDGATTGAPIALRIENRDWPNWKDRELPQLTVPRPGHADLAGALKYGHTDLRLVSERASARETAMRVAIGAIARRLLAEVGIAVVSHVIAIGEARVAEAAFNADAVEASPVRCADPRTEAEMLRQIEEARAQGDSVGGLFEVIATGVPPGLGSFVHWDRRLDGRLAQALMSIPAIKGVEIGAGFATAMLRGTAVHDELFLEGDTIHRRTNRAGGIEGGVTNGEPLVLRAAMKPIPTTVKPLRSVDLATGTETQSQYQRSDVCAVPAASVVGEAVVAWVLAEALVEKCGGDHLAELRTNLDNYLRSIKAIGNIGRPQ